MNHELLLNSIQNIQHFYHERNKKVKIEVYVDHLFFREMIEYFKKTYGSIVPYGVSVDTIEFNGAHIYREDVYHDYIKIEVKETIL